MLYETGAHRVYIYHFATDISVHPKNYITICVGFKLTAPSMIRKMSHRYPQMATRGGGVRCGRRCKVKSGQRNAARKPLSSNWDSQPAGWRKKNRTVHSGPVFNFPIDTHNRHLESYHSTMFIMKFLSLCGAFFKKMFLMNAHNVERLLQLLTKREPTNKRKTPSQKAISRYGFSDLHTSYD